MKTKNNQVKTDNLIIGNSAAGLAAAQAIRKTDKKSSLCILTGEKYSNYSKPLITYYLSGKLNLDKVYFKDKNFYKENNINLKLGKKVISVNPGEKSVLTANGDKYFYKSLLIASGGKPLIPGIKVIDESGSESELREVIHKIKGIFTLTTLDDAVNLKKYINEHSIKSASILGGGLIGLKAAEAFLELGMNINIIELSETLLSASFDQAASEIISGRIMQAGSNIMTGHTIEEIYTGNGIITGFKLNNGSKIPGSLLVIAIGVLPDVEFLEGSGIKTNKGIVVDDHMKTSMDNVYAAGDIIKSYDMLACQDRNMAIWPIAVKQGSIAGQNMAGENATYGGAFLMNSVEILGVPVISLGLSNTGKLNDDSLIGGQPDLEEHYKVYKTYDSNKNVYRKIIIRNNRVIGAILIGSIERAGIYYGLMNNRIDISEIKEKIAKEDFGIIQLPADYRKHLVVGEGIEV